MKYKKFRIPAYKAIVDSEIAVTETPVPIIGVNESGKSSALEAMAHFDFRNDELIAQKGWSYRNRYRPDDSQFSIVCDIEITQNELDKIRQPLLLPQPEPEPTPEPVAEPSTPVAEQTPASLTDPATTQAVTSPETATEPPIQPGASPEPVEDELNNVIVESENTLPITRSFNSQDNTKAYSINGVTGQRIEELARAIIQKLARVYYFDNFLETEIPDKVDFSKSYIDGSDDKLTEHQAIIEGAFSDSGVNLRDYFNNNDSDSQATLISKVSANVTKKIIDDWRKMHVPAGEIDLTKYNTVTIMFKLGDNKKSIEIKVLEQFPGKDGTPSPQITMKISERSLGFRWFFNFSARKCFAAVHEEQFLYLIDEPGSYLHNSAQTVLLDALIDLAKQHPVVFSTHSEFLLDPEKININRIKIVQKEDHAIKLIPLSNASVKKHEGALSTLYNALRMRTPLETVMNKKVVVTEGITDFYFWKPILLDVAFLPGSGAGSNRYLLSIAIGAAKKYVAIFDGDSAGDKARSQYEAIYGHTESQNWLAYQNSQGTPSGLEKLLSGADTQRIKTISEQNDIKQAITMLFFNNKANEFWAGIDTETKANVQHNIDRFSTHLNLAGGNIGQGFTITPISSK